MADKQVNIIISAMDKATSTIQSVGWSLSDFAKRNQQTFQGMAVAWWVAFWAIAAYAYKSLDAYKEVERANRQLEHTILWVSKWTKEQLEWVKELTNALEKKAGIDSDSLNFWVAQLSTFWLQTKSVIGLTKSLADLTVNQDWVNASSDQYISSANLIQKALQWQFWKLEMMWIRFTEAQQQIINFWTEEEKVATINEWFAQNLRETTDTVWWLDVSMAKVQRNLENVSEWIWQALAPALNKILEAVTPLIEKLSEWIAKNPELAWNILLVAWAIAWLVAWIWLLWLALPAIITWFTLLTWPIWIITLAVTALAYGFYLLFTKFPTYEQQMQSLNDKMLTLDEQYKLWVITQAEYDLAMAKTREEMALLEEKSMTLWGTIRNDLAQTVYSIANTGETVSNFVNWVGAWFDRLAAWLWEWVLRMFKNIGLIYQANIWALKAAWDWLWNWMTAMMWSAYDWIVGKFNALTGFITGVVDKLRSLWQSAQSFLWWWAPTGKRALWWTVMANKPYLVWENGPELFTPSTTWSINNNPTSNSIPNININLWGVVINNESDEYSLAEKISDTLKRQLQLYQLWVN